jgi:hypothetical protein
MWRNPVTPSAQSPSIGERPLELEAKLGEERNGGIDVFHHDADVVHTLDRHDVPWRLTFRFCRAEGRAQRGYASVGQQPGC